MMIGSKYLIDTHTWIEYFKGSSQGKKAAEIIDNKENIILISDATYAELYSWAVREKITPGNLINLMRNRSRMLDINTNIWIEAADAKERARKKHPGIGIIDSLLLAMQKLTGATIVTGDPHFKGMKDVVLL